MNDDGWADALKGCEYVLHLASPVIPGKVDEDLLVKPAVEGMERCLNAAIKNGAKNLYKHHLMLQFMEEKITITSIVILIGLTYLIVR